jgi:hypothetical protein
MTNLMQIKKGATWNWGLKFWDDTAKTIPKDVSGYTFAFKASNSSGIIITLTNSDFIAPAINHRIVTLSKSQTDSYPSGELYYQLDVDMPDGTSEEWMQGYINIVP